MQSTKRSKQRDELAEALEELLACKDLKEQIAAIDNVVIGAKEYAEREILVNEYDYRKPLAWIAARAALVKLP